MKLYNKVAIVTGASRGIGFAIVDAFLREGAKVALNDIHIDWAQKAVNTLRAKYPQADLMPVEANIADTAAVNAMVKAVVTQWGTINILVNNAGITSAKRIFDTTDEEFEAVIRINLTGAFKCTREVAKIMKDQGGGSIVNTSSMMGTYGGKMQIAYSSSKFGINGLTKSCAKELGPYGIRVNAVAPGVVGTDMASREIPKQMMATLKSQTPLGRMASPEELAGAYVYLASDEASFTTGTILSVDGGIVL